MLGAVKPLHIGGVIDISWKIGTLLHTYIFGRDERPYYWYQGFVWVDRLLAEYLKQILIFQSNHHIVEVGTKIVFQYVFHFTFTFF
jgi:hypothetical protein